MASASITGTVVDPSGAIVQGALVKLQNLDTNQILDVRTDDRGRYRLLYVPAGRHRLSARAQGFSPAQVTLAVTVGQALDIPLRLAAAAASETISVSAPAPLVDAARTQTADTIKPQEIDALPLNGRNYLDLALLVPNVSRTNTRANDRFAETSAVPGTGISVAGQRNLGNSFIVDGLSANDDAADLAGTYYAEDVIRVGAFALKHFVFPGSRPLEHLGRAFGRGQLIGLRARCCEHCVEIFSAPRSAATRHSC